MSVGLLLAGALLGGCARTVYVSGGDCLASDPPYAGGWVWVNGVQASAGDAELAPFYPGRALRREVQGYATLRCGMGACKVIDEASAPSSCAEKACWRQDEDGSNGYGFGAAAEKAARARGLVDRAVEQEIRVAFQITGPGRGRTWACGEAPPE
ncbi:MAG: hypothetical protein KF842_10590 [Caulobacter sp.]|nr:hypothetical protein [Caulobacter sp.]